MAVAAAVSVGLRFSVWRTLADSFRVFRLNFLTFALVALVTHLIWPLAPSVPPPQSDTGSLDVLTSDLLRTLVGLLVTCLTQLGLVFGTVRTLLGHRSSTRDIWSGLRAVVPAFAAGVICYAPILVFAIVEWTLAAYPIARGLIALPLLFIMLYFMLNYWLTTPVIAMEQRGILAAFKRSGQLTKGCRLKIAATWLLVGITMVVVTVLVAFATGQGLLELLASKPTTVPGAVLYATVAIWGAFFATFTNVAYFHLRAEKDGVAEGVARIFD